MLEHYYDPARADDFERLFGGLKIGRNPTPRHNQYSVLKLNFPITETHYQGFQTGTELKPK